MFSTRSRSSAQTPPGRHSSRRLQLPQVTSNLALFIGLKLFLGWNARTAGMSAPLGSRGDGGAAGDHVAHPLDFAALVEKIARSELGGEAPVGLGGEVGQHVDL